MNRIYRLIWDEVLGAFVVASELASPRGKKSGGTAAVLGALLLVLAPGLHAQAGPPPATASLNHAPVRPAAPADALPTGAQVVSGSATLNQQGNHLGITQDSQKLVINWAGFDIGADASVQFLQPSATAIALNRVLGNQASFIEGQLGANGQVWLVNPNGTVFGSGAQVDVGGLVVSSLGISDEDFLAGNARFSAGATAGAVINNGTLQAAGVLALIAPEVSSNGHIAADQVALAAGQTVGLDFGLDGLLSLQVDSQALATQIAHGGAIQGRNVVLSAAAASALQSSVINLDGVVEATGLVERGGRIVLEAGEHGTVNLGGRLDASSQQGMGGQIAVTADTIALESGAVLAADGASGGGTIHVGGGWQGGDADLYNARQVAVEAGASVSARALDHGNGGEVVFWSDDSTRFAGTINVRGGEQGGEGGRAEVSGKQTLAYRGLTDARATHGQTGDLLLDPDALTVYGGAGTGDISGNVVYEKDIEAQTANVLLNASGDITFQDLGQNGGDGVITMQQDVSLRVETGGTNGIITFVNKNNTVEVSGTGSIMLVAGGTGSGRIVNAPNLIARGAGTNPAILPTHNVTSPGSGVPSAGSITIYGADGVSLGGALTTNGGYVRIWGDSDNQGGGDLTVDSPIRTSGGNLYLSTGSGEVLMRGDTVLGTGRVYFRADGTHTTGTKTLAGLLSVSGDVNVDTPFKFNAGASIHTDGDINFGNVAINLNTGEGVLTLRANRIDWGSATLQNLSTASLRLEPYDVSTNMVLGDASGFASATTLNKLPGIKNLTIGREDGTGTISVSGDYTFNATNNFEVVNRTIDLTAGSLSNSTGNVILTGDTLNIGHSVVAKGGAGKVTVRQATKSNSLTLGGSGLTNTTLGHIDAATVEIGRADGGSITFAGDIQTNADTVHLKTSGEINGKDYGVSARHLAVTAGTRVELEADAFDFETLAVNMQGSGATSPYLKALSHREQGWTLGTVDGVSGLTLTNHTGVTRADVHFQSLGTMALNGPVNYGGVSNVYAHFQAEDAFTSNASLNVTGASKASTEFQITDTSKDLVVSAAGTGVIGSATLEAFETSNVLRLLTTGTQDISISDVDLAGTRQLHLSAREGKVTFAGPVSLAGSGTLYVQAGKGIDINGATRVEGVLELVSRDLASTSKDITSSAVITAGKLRLTGDNVSLEQLHQVDRLEQIQVGSLVLNNGRSLTIGTSNDASTVARTATISAVGATSDLRLEGHIAVQNQTGVATPLTLVAGRNFQNLVTASAPLSVTNGRWLIYSTNPTADIRGNLLAEGNFKQYNATAATDSVPATTVAGTGNGFMYRVAPTLETSLAGNTSKTYDGESTVTDPSGLVVSTSGLIDGDSVTYTLGNAYFANASAGSGKMVTADIDEVEVSKGNLTVYGYQTGEEVGGEVGTILRKELSLASGSVLSKVYDATVDATINSRELSGIVGEDDVRVAGAGSAVFADKNVGVGKEVSLSGLSLEGDAAANYTLSTLTSADITKRTVRGVFVAGDKVYDGTTAAVIDVLRLTDVIAGDDLDIEGSASFIDRDAGTGKHVDLVATLVGGDRGNYSIDPGLLSAKADIEQRVVSARELEVRTKEYDGTTDANLTLGRLSNTVAGDLVSLQHSGRYRDANAGAGKAVDVELALAGADAHNYVLAAGQVTLHGDIDRRLVALAPDASVRKVYDGTREIHVDGLAATRVVVGDDLSIGAEGLFEDRNAGVGKTVELQLALAGDSARNYALVESSVRARGDITPRPIDVVGVSVAGKIYDGTTAASLSSGGLSGLVAGDQVGVALSGQFADKNAGLGKVVSVEVALTGADAANYLASQASLVARGDITPREISAGGISVADKVYDGTRGATVSGGVLQGVLAGDDLGLLASGEFADRNAGLDKQAQVRLGLSGADAGNYVLDQDVLQTTADITPRQLTAGAVVASGKSYDGTTGANIILPALEGVLEGDQVRLDGQGRFADSLPGTDKSIRVELSLAGADAGNYQLLDPSRELAGTIAAPRSVGAVDSLTGNLDRVAGQLPGIDGGSGSQGAVPGSAGIAQGAAAGGAAGAASPQMPSLTGKAGTSGVGVVPDHAGAAADSGADAGSRGAGAVGLPASLDVDQVLRRPDGSVSVGLGDEPLVQPQASRLPMFLEADASLLGQYRVEDSGDALALRPDALGGAGQPDLSSPVRLSLDAVVSNGGEDDVTLRLELLDDGTLRIVVPAKAASLGREVVAAYALAALKRHAGVAPSQVRAMVLRYEG